jgi:hypothetical protein
VDEVKRETLHNKSVKPIGQSKHSRVEFQVNQVKQQASGYGEFKFSIKLLSQTPSLQS